MAHLKYYDKQGIARITNRFDYGHTLDKGCRVRHEAQLAWNGAVV
jgi:hypothetical protein